MFGSVLISFFDVRVNTTSRGAFNAAAVAVLAVFCGCSPVNNQNALRNPAPIQDSAYPSAFDASAAVLRDAGFHVDRQDFRFGKVSSTPKGSPTVIEAWKPDNTYADQALRSTLGDLRRSVTVSFSPANDAPTAEPSTTESRPAGGYRVEVAVLVERLQIPERRMNGTTRGSVFADLAEVPQELQDRGITQRYWEPIGRDVHLEQRLLQDILRRAEP